MMTAHPFPSVCLSLAANRAPVWQEKISLGCQEATTPIEIVLGNDLTKQACVRWTLPDWMAGTSDTQSVVESPAVDAAAPAADASTAITEGNFETRQKGVYVYQRLWQGTIATITDT